MLLLGNIGGDIPPVQQTPQLVAHIDHHDLLAGTGKVGDLALDGLGHTRVDCAAQATIRGHANDQVLAPLVLRRLDLGLLVQSCRRSDTGRQISPITSQKQLKIKRGHA